MAAWEAFAPLCAFVAHADDNYSCRRRHNWNRRFDIVSPRATDAAPAWQQSGEGVASGVGAEARRTLLGQGLLRQAGLLSLPPGFYSPPSLRLLWAFLLLARVRTPRGCATSSPANAVRCWAWTAVPARARCA